MAVSRPPVSADSSLHGGEVRECHHTEKGRGRGRERERWRGRKRETEEEEEERWRERGERETDSLLGHPPVPQLPLRCVHNLQLLGCDPNDLR